ncbi:hypothetical protein AB0D35_28145 [Streptomyces sp. NPDC048301]|uniref:hypothetical protein n=1 Tax=unclassified Streptomyces TaxID=2593676 RepID=UPI00343C6805
MNPEKESARGLAQVEGYLLWNAEVDKARRQARSFTDELPWLTTAQRDDVERVYTADRIEAGRETLTRIAGRALELRGEYAARYDRLRTRCVAASVLFACVAGGACAVPALLSR